MHLQKYILCICLMAFSCYCNAQNYSWEEFVEDFFQQEDNVSEEEQNSLLEDLQDIHHNPFDINSLKKENLELLPFLTQQQTDSILSYLRRYGPMLSLKELFLIPSLDKKTRDYLSLFVYCQDKEGSPYNIRPGYFLKWRQQVTTNLNIPLYQRDGFKTGKYHGQQFSSAIRYRGQWKDRVEWGVTLQNDEGEPFCSHGNYIFDYQSFFLTGKGHGCLDRWIVGDYKIQFGLGLTVGQGYWNNMMSLLTFSKNTRQTIFKHTSSDESRFFRGGAVMLRSKWVNLTLFGSYRLRDATLKNDGITTLLTTGLHRTTSELDRKNDIVALTAGGNLDYSYRQWSVGLSAIHTSFDKSFANSTTLYKKYYMTGKNFGNYSLYYSYNSSRFSLQGEEAIDSKGYIAALNKITFTPTYNFKAILLHRYYDKAYNAPYAFAYSSRGYIKNEHGIMGGVNYIFKRKWQFKVALDYSYHPFATYNASTSSKRMSLYSQAEYLHSDKTSFLIRYQLKGYQEDNVHNNADLFNVYKHRFKLQSHYNLGILKNVSAIDFTYTTTQKDKPEYGTMVSHRVSAKIKKYTLTGVAAWFNTTSYSSALYLYEPGPVYSFSYPSCFYHGWRAMAMFSGKITNKLNFAIKYGHTHYTNKNTISSSTQLINHPYKNDLYIQLKILI